MLDMATLIDFLKGEQENLSLPGPSGSCSLAHTHDAVADAVSTALEKTDLPNGDAIKFAEKVGTLVTGDKFLQELSNVIGQPKLSESEDEFVARCKQSMFGLLTKRLG